MRPALLIVLMVAGCAEPPRDELAPFVAAEVGPVGFVDRTGEYASVTRERLREFLPILDVTEVTSRVIKTESVGGLARNSLIFESFDGSGIPAILQVPDNPIGAVLIIPGHVRDDGSGLSELVYRSDSTLGAAATELAKAGFTTLTFELRGFGLLKGEGHRHVAWNAIAAGTSYKAVVLQDAQYAMSLLRSVSGAEPFVAGASLGGELAATLAAIDERIPAVAVSAYGGSVGLPPLSTGKQPHYCHVIPGLYASMAREDIFKLIAPRPLGIFREGQIDDGFADDLGRAWGDAPLRIEVIGNTHRFFVEPTIRFFSELN